MMSGFMDDAVDKVFVCLFVLNSLVKHNNFPPFKWDNL